MEDIDELLFAMSGDVMDYRSMGRLGLNESSECDGKRRGLPVPG
jgi:hypothetical protein